MEAKKQSQSLVDESNLDTEQFHATFKYKMTEKEVSKKEIGQKINRRQAFRRTYKTVKYCGNQRTIMIIVT